MFFPDEETEEDEDYFAESGGLLPFAGSAFGFSRDHCNQLQVRPWPSLLGHAHPSGRCLGHRLDAQTLPDPHTCPMDKQIAARLQEAQNKRLLFTYRFKVLYYLPTVSSANVCSVRVNLYFFLILILDI
jgi:hypothetical protein